MLGIHIYKYLNKCLLLMLVAMLMPTTLVSQESSRVEALMDKMSIREKVAQLFIVSFSADEKDKSTIEAMELIKTEGIGGVIVMDTDLIPAVNMFNKMHSLSKKIPLLMTIDGEWGPAMRFNTITPFPRQMQLGALSSDSLIYRMGVAIGIQTKRLGIDVNFAPSVDINSNPKNPVINTRSFGENIDKVTDYGLAYMLGMKSVGVVGSAKHFPGHGDTEVDSHLALPELPFSRERIDSVELRPFKAMIDAAVDMVMVGHLRVPTLDNSGTPASISKPIITGLLKEELGYKGIVITDALNMKGVADYLKPEEIPLAAYKAGCDIILMPSKAKEAISVMERAVKSGDISLEDLNMRCRKMLELKERLGVLDRGVAVDIANIERDLNRPEYISLINDMANKSVTLIDNSADVIPIKDLKESIGYLSLGGDKNGKEMAGYFMRYSHIDTVVLRGKYKPADLRSGLDKLKSNGHIIIAVHNTDFRPQMDFGINKEDIKIISEFAVENKVSFVYFGNPLAIPYIEGRDNFASFILGYNNTDYNNMAAAQIIFGANEASGKLPLTAGALPEGYGLSSEGALRLNYGLPEDFNISGERIESVADSIVLRDMAAGKFSGAQLLLIHKERVILNRSYGNLNNDTSIELNRISGFLTMLPLIAKLNSIGKLSIVDFVNEYIGVETDSVLESAIIADLLMHRVEMTENISSAPHYSEKNMEYLRAIIETAASKSMEEMAKEFFIEIGMNRSSFINGKARSSANDIAKLATLISKRGSYGGIRHLNHDSADLFSQYSFYYSSDQNGSLVWRDEINDLTIIFLNDGGNSEDDTYSSIGDTLRRSILSVFLESTI